MAKVPGSGTSMLSMPNCERSLSKPVQSPALVQARDVGVDEGFAAEGAAGGEMLEREAGGRGAAEHEVLHQVAAVGAEALHAQHGRGRRIAAERSVAADEAGVEGHDAERAAVVGPDVDVAVVQGAVVGAGIAGGAGLVGAVAGERVVVVVVAHQVACAVAFHVGVEADVVGAVADRLGAADRAGEALEVDDGGLGRCGEGGGGDERCAHAGLDGAAARCAAGDET
jgi:hypothetical protein